jgi:hypothetical protein
MRNIVISNRKREADPCKTEIPPTKESCLDGVYGSWVYPLTQIFCHLARKKQKAGGE